ncbi:MAG: N-acetyl-gamma-glutamyl-phosphate reductase [Lautropia sp.]|nr:N-acetyl-gamma-glutamyl-phosphate reductase [Lautropia sp.]
MTYSVFVDGQEGTTGLQINEFLSRRAGIEVLRIDPDRRKDPAERARLLNAADVSFLCLPDAAAREAATLVTNPRTCIIDASSAHRTQAGWVYGLPELAPGQRELIRAGKRIANPGCHASAFILLVRPLVAAGQLPPDYPISCFSITGYSGGGKNMIEQYRAGGDERLEAPRQYGLGLSHKHLPEIKTHGRLSMVPIFAPVVGNFYKGLAVSIGLRTDRLGGGASPESVHQVLASYYEGERFLRVMPLNDPQTLEGAYFDLQACNDTNRVDVFVFGREDQIMLISRMDNLGKGASGAAVQSMNLHLGLDEGLGLA